MKKRIILTTFYISIYLLSFPQTTFIKDTIYVNENKKLSTKELTLNKCKSDVYYCDIVAYDSLIAYQVGYNYFFGKLDLSKRKEIRETISSTLDFTLDTTSTIYLNYRFHLYNYDKYKRSIDSINKIRRTKVGDKIQWKLMTKKEMKKKEKEHLLNQKRCFKKIKKSNPNVIIIDVGSKKVETNFLKSVFRTNDKFYKFFTENLFNNDRTYKFMILKPNGNYFLKSFRSRDSDFSDQDIFNLIDKKNWESYFGEWERRKKTLQRSKRKIYIDKYFPKKCF